MKVTGKAVGFHGVNMLASGAPTVCFQYNLLLMKRGKGGASFHFFSWTQDSWIISLHVEIISHPIKLPLMI